MILEPLRKRSRAGGRDVVTAGEQVQPQGWPSSPGEDQGGVGLDLWPLSPGARHGPDLVVHFLVVVRHVQGLCRETELLGRLGRTIRTTCWCREFSLCGDGGGRRSQSLGLVTHERLFLTHNVSSVCLTVISVTHKHKNRRRGVTDVRSHQKVQRRRTEEELRHLHRRSDSSPQIWVQTHFNSSQVWE